MSVVVRSCHACATRSRFLSHRRCTLTEYPFTDYRSKAEAFSLCEIFKHAHLKFTVYGRKQASKQGYTRMCAMQSRYVGFAHACPNYLKQANRCICCVIWSWVSCFANGEIQLYLKALWIRTKSSRKFVNTGYPETSFTFTLRYFVCLAIMSS